MGRRSLVPATLINAAAAVTAAPPLKLPLSLPVQARQSMPGFTAARAAAPVAKAIYQPRCQQHAASQRQPEASAPPPPAVAQQQHRRRQVLAGLAGAAGISSLAPPPAKAASAATISSPTAQDAAPLAPGSLAARLVTEGAIQQPGLQPPWAPKQIYYPRWMFGEWQVEMEFEGVRLPLGRRFVPPGFLQAAEAPAEQGGPGSRTSFRQKFYSTLPPTLDNTLRVNLGLGTPHDAVIADRAFNTRQSTDAFLGYQGAVESVEYDPRDAPLRQTVTLSRLGPDTAPLPPRRLELFINALSSEGGGEGSAFYTSELCRQVLLGVRQVEVSDYEVLHSYRQLGPGRLEGRQRSCLYLQPQDQLFFEAGGRAVAVYDYRLTMQRLPPPDDAPPEAQACVLTPKGVWQCV